MTYCVGILTESGLVMLADTRTNAGLDNISTYRKLHTFEVPGERLIALSTAGNLSISQGVLNLLQEGVPNESGDGVSTILDVPSLFEAAHLVGRAIRTVYNTLGPTVEAQDVNFGVSFLLGGQVADRRLRLFQVYSAGNFIEAGMDTPFLQIGEHKYGKPILDRAITYRTDVMEALKLALISMDSTLRSNLSVGLPADVLVYHRDDLRASIRYRIEPDDPYFTDLSERWSQALRDAHGAIAPPNWSRPGGRGADG